MAERRITIDPLIEQFVVNGAKDLISKIKKDIDDEKQISDTTYKTCNVILDEASKEYTRIQIAFVEETKILVQKALKQPQSQPTPSYHRNWTHVLDIFTAACQQLTGPILQVMNSVSMESAIDAAAIRAVYDRCSSQLQTLIVSFMPKILNKSKNVITENDLGVAIKEALNTFKIKEESWTDTDTLEMLLRQTDRVLDALKEKIHN